MPPYLVAYYKLVLLCVPQNISLLGSVLCVLDTVDLISLFIAKKSPRNQIRFYRESKTETYRSGFIKFR